jgi:hypothetical protein
MLYFFFLDALPPLDQDGLPAVVAERGSLHSRVCNYDAVFIKYTTTMSLQVWDMYRFMMERLSQVMQSMVFNDITDRCCRATC